MTAMLRGLNSRTILPFVSSSTNRFGQFPYSKNINRCRMGASAAHTASGHTAKIAASCKPTLNKRHMILVSKLVEGPAQSERKQLLRQSCVDHAFFASEQPPAD